MSAESADHVVISQSVSDYGEATIDEEATTPLITTVTPSSSEGENDAASLHSRSLSSSSSVSDPSATPSTLLAIQRSATLMLPHENAFRAFSSIHVEQFLANNDYEPLTGPSAEELEGVLLFVDMSGFTVLSERLSALGPQGIEALSKHLNQYFSPMVDLVHSYNGDICKFAGDALLIVFELDQAYNSAGNSNSTRAGHSRNASLGSTVNAHSTPPLQTEAVQGSSSTNANASRPRRHAMREAILRACSCALAVHAQFDGFSPANGVTLRLHSAVSAGTMYSVHVGGYAGRWEWLLKGKPLHQLSEAMHISEKGQIVLHSSAFQYVSDAITSTPVGDEGGIGHLLQVREGSSLPPNLKRPHLTIHVPHTAPDLIVSIASSSNLVSPSSVSPIISPSFSHSPHSPLPIGSQHKPRPLSTHLLTAPLDRSQSLLTSTSTAPRSYQMSLRDFFRRRSALVSQSLSPAIEGDVFPTFSRSRAASSQQRNVMSTIISEEEDIKCELVLRAYVPAAVLARVSAGHRAWLAEFRRITTLFIKLPEQDWNTADPSVRAASLHSLQAMVMTLMQVCSKHKGDIRQLITDDKGTVTIMLFGLQADWSNPLRGVRAAIEIVEQMKALGHRVAIGITTGKVCVGAIGNYLRSEYTAIGDKINTAARLMMAVPNSDGIYADQDTVMATGTSSAISFDALTPITVKGKQQPVAIFSPHLRSQASISKKSIQHINASWKTRMIGRKQQLEMLDRFFAQREGDNYYCPLLYIEAAQRGMGKSVLLSAAYAKCLESRCIVLMGAATEGQSLPYNAFESIIPKLLKILHDLEIGECQLPASSSSTSRVISASRPDAHDHVDVHSFDAEGDHHFAPPQHVDAVVEERALLDDEDDISHADWLHDPDVLAIENDLKQSGELCLLNDLSSIVNFQHTQGITISFAPPPSVSALTPDASAAAAASSGWPAPRQVSQQSVAISRSFSQAVTPSNSGPNNNSSLSTLTAERFHPLLVSSHSADGSTSRFVGASRVPSGAVSPHFATVASSSALPPPVVPMLDAQAVNSMLARIDSLIPSPAVSAPAKNVLTTSPLKHTTDVAPSRGSRLFTRSILGSNANAAVSLPVTQPQPQPQTRSQSVFNNGSEDTNRPRQTPDSRSLSSSPSASSSSFNLSSLSLFPSASFWQPASPQGIPMQERASSMFGSSRALSRHNSSSPTPMDRTRSTHNTHQSSSLSLPMGAKTINNGERAQKTTGANRAAAIVALMCRLLTRVKQMVPNRRLVIMIDDAHELDSASEHLLLQIARQLPWIVFIFSALKTDEPCNLRRALVAFQSQSERAAADKEARHSAAVAKASALALKRASAPTISTASKHHRKRRLRPAYSHSLTTAHTSAHRSFDDDLLASGMMITDQKHAAPLVAIKKFDSSQHNIKKRADNADDSRSQCLTTTIDEASNGVQTVAIQNSDSYQVAEPITRDRRASQPVSSSAPASVAASKRSLSATLAPNHAMKSLQWPAVTPLSPLSPATISPQSSSMSSMPKSPDRAQITSTSLGLANLASGKNSGLPRAAALLANLSAHEAIPEEDELPQQFGSETDTEEELLSTGPQSEQRRQHEQLLLSPPQRSPETRTLHVSNTQSRVMSINSSPAATSRRQSRTMALTSRLRTGSVLEQQQQQQQHVSSEQRPLEAIVIELRGMSEPEIEELLLSLLKCQSIDPRVCRLITERSSGVPLFAEELAVQLLHARMIQIVPEQHFAASSPSPHAHDTPTLPSARALNSIPSFHTGAASLPSSAIASVRPMLSIGIPRLLSLEPRGGVADTPEAVRLVHHPLASGMPRASSNAPPSFSRDASAHAMDSSASPMSNCSSSSSVTSTSAPASVASSPSNSHSRYIQQPSNHDVEPPLHFRAVSLLPNAGQLAASFSDQSARSPQAIAANGAIDDMPVSPSPHQRKSRPSGRVIQAAAAASDRSDSSVGSVALLRLRSRPVDAPAAPSPVPKPIRLVCCFTQSIDADNQLDLSSIPLSMDEMIASQIDMMPVELQLLLKICAVFGRVVDGRCVRQVWEMYGGRRGGARFNANKRPPKAAEGAPAVPVPPVVRASTEAGEFEQSMEALVERKWLKRMAAQEAEQSGALSKETVKSLDKEQPPVQDGDFYVFRHAVVVSVAYNRMPFAMRGILHKTCAEWYEQVYATSLSTHYSRLAWHWQQAARFVGDAANASNVAVQQQQQNLQSATATGTASSSSPDSWTSSAPHSPDEILPVSASPVGQTRNAALIAHSASIPHELDKIPSLAFDFQSINSPPHALERMSLSVAPSASILWYCRRRAILYLRLTGEAAARQGARREAIALLKTAIDFVESLPDKEDLNWKRELLVIRTTFCSCYSIFHGLSEALKEWTTLCSLCDEVQHLSDEAQAGNVVADVWAPSRPQQQDEASMAVARSTFWALRGYQLALQISSSDAVDPMASRVTAQRLNRIAEKSGDWFLIANALVSLALVQMTVCEYDDVLSNNKKAFNLCASHDDFPPYQVNTLSPLDPACIAMTIMALIHCVRGDLRSCASCADHALWLAERNQEPVTWSFVVTNHALYTLLCGVPEENFARYFDFLQTEGEHQHSDNNPNASLSNLTDILVALHAAREAEEQGNFHLDDVQAAADKAWARYQSGSRFYIGHGSALCELLYLAGYWEIGLLFVADWRRLSMDGALGHMFPECLRFDAIFLLDQAEALIEMDELNALDVAPDLEIGVILEGAHEDLAVGDLSQSRLTSGSTTTPQASSPSSRSSSMVRSSSESSRASTPPPLALDSSDAWDLRNEARLKLEEAIQMAHEQTAWFLELRALLTLLPLLRFFFESGAVSALSPSSHKSSSHNQFARDLMSPSSRAAAMAEEAEFDRPGLGKRIPSIVLPEDVINAPFDARISQIETRVKALIEQMSGSADFGILRDAKQAIGWVEEEEANYLSVSEEKPRSNSMDDAQGRAVSDTLEVNEKTIEHNRRPSF